MSRTDSLQWLATVIDDLGPIGQMTPGVPLRATDWNAVVGAVGNLARLVASREDTTDSFLDQRYATIDHRHTDQATLAWFEPQTRALLEQGVSGAVEQRAELKTLGNQLAELRSEVAGLRDELRGVRIEVDGLRDSDAARERGLSGLSLRLEAVADTAEGVTALDGRLGEMTRDIATVLEFRRELTDAAGNTIDVRAVEQRVTGLEGLRENLLTADGELVRIREIESALARLEENSVDRNAIDEVILERLREGEILDEAGLVDSVSERVEDRFTPRFEEIEAGGETLGAGVETLGERLDEKDAQVEALEKRADATDDTLAAQAGLGQQVTGLGKRVSTVETLAKTNQTAVAGLPALRKQLDGVEGSVARLPVLEERLGGLEKRVGRLDGNVRDLATLPGGVDALGKRLDGAEERLTLLNDLDQRVGETATATAALDERLSAGEAQLDNLEGLPGRFDDIAQATGNLGPWRGVVDTRLKDLAAGIRAAGVDVQRLVRIEEQSAEHGSSLRELSKTVGGVSKMLPAVTLLATQVRDMDKRVKRLER